jgi:hypothetical protein
VSGEQERGAARPADRVALSERELQVAELQVRLREMSLRQHEVALREQEVALRSEGLGEARAARAEACAERDELAIRRAQAAVRLHGADAASCGALLLVLRLCSPAADGGRVWRLLLACRLRPLCWLATASSSLLLIALLPLLAYALLLRPATERGSRAAPLTSMLLALALGWRGGGALVATLGGDKALWDAAFCALASAHVACQACSAELEEALRGRGAWEKRAAWLGLAAGLPVLAAWLPFATWDWTLG